ncbi:hypothetical protein JQ615_37780 [Bradyrhizobium jicamae]|uniref:Uncharacterized protein n=1 Tax=Bradyrhizobium jicamae TaxID=280332 RepID=A0ABS5FWB7_9BRAD|nr:hypothetical protein [Bradyrhizobium jicamae]
MVVEASRRSHLYGFLATTPNTIVEPIDPNAMPVMLTTDEERDAESNALQWPLPDAALKIAPRGPDKRD